MSSIRIEKFWVPDRCRQFYYKLKFLRKKGIDWELELIRISFQTLRRKMKMVVQG